MLPIGTPYIDAYPNMPIDEAVEDVVVFDDVYPRMVGTVSNITTHEYKEVIQEDGKPDVVKKWNAYRFKDSGVTFSKDYVLDGQELKIIFQSGLLNGMEFAVTFNPCDKEGGETPIPEKNSDGTWNPLAQVWEIVRNEDYGRPLPDDVLRPQIQHMEGDILAPADTYILSGFDTKFVSDAMIPAAEQELNEKALKYIEKSKIDPSTYDNKMMFDCMVDDKGNLKMFEVGDRVNLINSAYFETGSRQSRIIGFEYHLDIPYDSPVYTVGETVSYSRIGEIENKIESLTYKGQIYSGVGGSGVYLITSNDKTQPSDRNAFSAKRAKKESLSKTGPDRTEHLLEMLGGTFVRGGIDTDSIIIRSDLNARQLKTVMSDALTEEGDENEEMMGFSLIEEGDGNEDMMSTSLSEVALDGGFGGGTLGELDNTDELFDTCPDGIYSLQKKAGVYYPVKGGVSSSKMTLSFVSTSTPVFAFGRTAIVRYRFSSIFDGEATGPGSATYTVNGKQVGSATIEQGECSFDAGKYLVLGDNILVVAATDAYGTVRKLTYNISTVSISASSTFDDSKPYSGAISFVYTPMGAIIKTVHFVVDGAEIGTEVTAISNRQLTYSIPAQEHGTHSLEVYITAEIDGVKIESNRLHYALICAVSGNMTPIIASSFTQIQAEQFSTLLIPYIVYNPAASMSSVTLSANGETISTQSVDRTGQSWSYRADDSGELTLTISCGGVAKSFQLTVSESAVDVHPETADLVLFLTSVNRSNNEEGRTVWSYGELYAVLTAFNWATNGWVKTIEGFTALRASGDARVIIPYYAFADDFRSTGKTIEFEFETRDVMDYEAVVLNCMSGNIGLEVTAQKAVFRSEQSKVETQFKEDERVRVAFVVEKRAENRLIYVYVNGEMCGVIRYPEQDNFMQSTPAGITIGNNDCTVDTFNIRIYDNNLNRYQLLDNYIGDMDSLELKRSLFARNQIYDAYGNVSYDKLLDYVPILTIIGGLPAYKGDKVTCVMEYEDRQHPSRCWTCPVVQNDVQGTSSQYYPRKNYKFKFKGDILLGGITANKFPIREGDIAVNCFCLKADFAESSGCHNTGLARMVDFVLRGLGQLTPPQKTDRRVRTTIDGYPIVIFHKQTADAPATFLGKYNFNNDKSTQETFGFTAGCECWELKNNTSDRVKFLASDYTSVDAAGNPDWLNDFEVRYPDDDDLNAEYEGGKIPVNLKRLTDWLVSVKGNPTRFKSEASGYLDIPFLLSYYTLTEFFGMVDQRAKNMFLTTYDGTHWIPIFYDNDTCLGINNEGVNTFDYTIEYHDKIGTQDVWNGEASSLWNNVESAYNDEVSDIYADMRKNNLLTYEECNRFLNTEQGDRWSESVYNEDSYYKYIRPLLDEGNGSYLYAAQGSRRMHRIWWLHNRFKYMDSKYVAGDFKNDYATMRLYTPTAWAGVKPNADITITSYSGQYVSVKYGSYVVGGRTKKNVPHRVVAPDIQFNDTETIIYGASQISNLGDLSALYAGTIDVSKMSKLTELIAGSGALGYKNTNLEVLSVGANDLLRKLDVRGCPNLHQPIDVSRCANIREVWAEGTGTTAVVLPEGGSLSLLHLPETITNLTVRNQPNLAEDGLMIAGVQNLTTIRWENTNGADVFGVIERCLKLDAKVLERIRLVGIKTELPNLNVLVALSKLQGIDVNGINMNKAVITGKCHVLLATDEKLKAMNAAFPELVITYDQMEPETVTTFAFSSSQSKVITSGVFECNFEYVKVDEATYRVSAENGEVINFVFSCDNHSSYSESYRVTSTRTHRVSVTYLPLRTLVMRRYQTSEYLPGAIVTYSGQRYTADSQGKVYLRGITITDAVVTYPGMYAKFSIPFSEIDNTVYVDVYSFVNVRFSVKDNYGRIITYANVVCNGEEQTTDIYGECVFRLIKGVYTYSVIANKHESIYDTVIEVDKIDVVQGCVVEYLWSAEDRPEENGNIQLLAMKGSSDPVCLGISSTDMDYIIDWGDGETTHCSGVGNQSYRHNYVYEDLYSIQISNCENITFFELSAPYDEQAARFNIVAFWSIGNSKIINFRFGASYMSSSSRYVFKNLKAIGNILKNDTERTDFSYFAGSVAPNIVYFPDNLLNTCVKAENFISAFYGFKKHKSIPQSLLSACVKARYFENCFSSWDMLENIPVGLFDTCLEANNFTRCFAFNYKITSELPRLWIQYYGKDVAKEYCFSGCTKAANWSEVPVSWGGTAPEYVPPIQIGGVMMADYRALEARIRNIELQQNMDKN